MPDQPFLVPKLVGRRFDGGVIPLDVLADFAALNDLLIETAKWEFFKDHPKRKKSPHGFDKAFQLKLTDIEDGSAKPIIQLVTTAAASLSLLAVPYMERARDTVISNINAAATGQAVTLPPKLLGHFERFGRNLEEGEVVEFGGAADGAPSARLDLRTRSTLLLARTGVAYVTDPAQVIGRVPDVKHSNNTFELQLSDGRRITGPFKREHRDAILEAVGGYDVGQPLLIDGIGRYDAQRRLIGFDSIGDVVPIDPLEFRVQFDDLRVLKLGWYDGKDGPAYQPVALDTLETLFYERYPDDLTLPHIYPTPEGQVRAEWLLKPFDASIEIDPNTLTGYWHTLNLNDDTDDERSLDLSQPDGWTLLAELIRKLPGGIA